MTIRIHIERLTVEGGSRADARQIGDALRTRLTELASAGLLPQSSQISRLDAGQLPHGASPDQIGRHTAGRIFQNLKGAPHA
jgi:hypothetical protein